ncbi:AAA family ATPase [Synechococcus sp. CBW1002]|uniref:AAA family ATPase n=1 Tax=unclassified Synechococcus TaxID=2626047 RepID=UPI0018CE68BE|nr:MULTISPECIES: AAA family ATPase [unclassified Synechococcus]QPN60283.1 AAA family ATPase [Synechococcus sp. CBW1002]CAK6700775.1 Chromosome partition protein Smc [Synechococcus sp. CBW1107]
MRLLSARIRDYRLHRDLTVNFDPRFTVIAGPNQSGKSTLAEALHRALFLPVKTGGAVLEGMKTDPFMADPEVVLAFAAGGDTWTLRKRFAGSRGSIALQDSGGRSLQGDAAEERLAELIGTAAVARNRAAADQLKERWGHLWVWQGSASDNPLALSSSAYDHDRLVERLQAGADLGVQSPLDLAVLDDIQTRWATVFTPGSATRAPQLRRGSELQRAREAMQQAEVELAAIGDTLQQQAQAQQAYAAATELQDRLAIELPQRRKERQALEERLGRSRELQTLIDQEGPLLEGLRKQLDEQRRDQQELQQQGQRVAALEAALAPKAAEHGALCSKLPAAEQQRQAARTQLDTLRQASATGTTAAEQIEQRLSRVRLQLQKQELAQQLSRVEQLQADLTGLEKDLQRLPAIDAKAVEALRRLGETVQTSRARAEAMATGLEVIRAGQSIRVDGEDLTAGTTRLLAEPTVLRVGNDVELRLVPGGGTTAAAAQQKLQDADAALGKALRLWQVSSVEEAATAERRRSDLLAERERLAAQRGAEDPASIRQRLTALEAQLAAQPADPIDDTASDQDSTARLASLELDLQNARAVRTQALAAEQQQQRSLEASEAALEALKASIETTSQALRDGESQLLEARTRINAVLQRCRSAANLETVITELVTRLQQSEARLAALVAERAALEPDHLDLQARSLDRAIATLQQQEREAHEARIRAESRLHGDGRIDLQAELEQKQAELESRRVERERLEQEAGTLNLLRQLLEEEQNAMASQYAAPLTKRIATYLAHVFPDAPRTALSYDARHGFQQLQWRRGGEAAFPFEVLSTGAREQFAAALRVAMAEVLAGAYDGSLPLLFDDAFAHSDRERQAGVVRMLTEASAQGLQVVLLTCDLERSTLIETATQVRLGSG